METKEFVKVVYHSDWYDEVEEVSKPCVRCEIFNDQESAQKWASSFGVMEDGSPVVIGTFRIQVPVEIVKRGEELREYLNHSGEFNFSGRRKHRREFREWVDSMYKPSTPKNRKSPEWRKYMDYVDYARSI